MLTLKGHSWLVSKLQRNGNSNTKTIRAVLARLGVGCHKRTDQNQVVKIILK